MPDFLPVNKDDLKKRGIDQLDIILISGDAYIDHPSFGSSLIGRYLESKGFTVGIIPQPNWKSNEDFFKLGKPKLFFGISAGNLDSMVANYTADNKVRRNDMYTQGDQGGKRPDRATIVYTSKIKGLFPGVPIVLGGVEASLRRLTHFDYWAEDVRRSILVDAKADILVYGMGETQVLEIARRLCDAYEKRGQADFRKGTGTSPSAREPVPENRPVPLKLLSGIRGTVIVRSSNEGCEGAVQLPSYEEVSTDKDKFNEAFRLAYLEGDPVRGKPVIQKHGTRFVIQEPPPLPLATAELDHFYGLPFARDWHPVYEEAGGVPGFETVRFSITAHRGCAGECNFCSLSAHQGRMIQSRSKESILKEIQIVAARPQFKGTITDIGGPTANLYGATCDQWDHSGACRGKQCMMPTKCKDLQLGYKKSLELLKEILAIPKVKHLFIQSGLRYDLLVEKESDAYLEALCRNHVSGQLKVAPEHASEAVLKRMNKPSFRVYQRFAERFKAMNRKVGKVQYLVNYFISAHPGCTDGDARELASCLTAHRMHPEQVQDFMPLPMTLSTCMYYTGKHPMTGEPVATAKTYKERQFQRELVQPKTGERGTGNERRKSKNGKRYPLFVSRFPKERSDYDSL